MNIPSSHSPSFSHCCFASCSISMASAALGHCPMRSGCSFRINERKACCTKEISWASTVSPKMPLALKTCITNQQIWWMRKVFQRCQLFQQKKCKLIQENVSEIVFSLSSCQDLTFASTLSSWSFSKSGCPKSPGGSPCHPCWISPAMPLSRTSCASAARSARSPGMLLPGAAAGLHPQQKTH